MEQQMQGATINKEVTVILTSCGRFDLLRRTIESFLLHNTYPIKEWWIYEDSGQRVPDELKRDFPFITWITRLTGERNQIEAIDTLWQRVATPWAMFLEDDWEFCKGRFIEDSMAILEAELKIMQVWLQPLEENNVHPINWYTHAGTDMPKFGVMAPLFSAIRLNPSLKRKSDYDLIAPFAKHTTWNPEKPWKCEADIAKVYTSLGYRAAILPGRYIKHIGEGRHISA